MKILISLLFLIISSTIVLSADILETEYFIGHGCDPSKSLKIGLQSPCNVLGRIEFIDANHYGLFSVSDASKINSQCKAYNEEANLPQPLEKCINDTDTPNLSYIYRKRVLNQESDMIQLAAESSCSQIISYGSDKCAQNLYMITYNQNTCFYGALSDGSNGYILTNCTSERSFYYECGTDSTCRNCTILNSPVNSICEDAKSPIMKDLYIAYQYNSGTPKPINPGPSVPPSNTPAPTKTNPIVAPSNSSKLFVSFIQFSFILALLLL